MGVASLKGLNFQCLSVWFLSTFLRFNIAFHLLFNMSPSQPVRVQVLGLLL